jgi:outer membrane protein TolC
VIKRILIGCISYLSVGVTNAQLTFNTIDSLLHYAEKNSVTIKVGDQQSILAKWTKVAAMANTINFRNPVSFSSTDNIMLPVNFIPGDFFGGPPGSFREITLGQRYISNFNLNPQIDIINPYTWSKVKSASINKELTEVNNLINKKSLYESIAAAFFNIVAFQEQVKIMEHNHQVADSLVLIAKNKFSQGIIREQDVNNLSANLLAVNDKLTQLKLSLEQQYNTLQILCDIPKGTSVKIENPVNNSIVSDKLKSTALLKVQYNELQTRLAKSELRSNRMAMMPVISFVYFQGWQQNSNSALFDNNAKLIQSRYIGLRISVPFPPDVNKMTQSYNSKISYRISLLNHEHMRLQNELNNESTELEYEKYLSGYETAKRILELKQSNYTKSLNQYKEGILNTDLLLQAFSDLLGSELNLASAKSALEFNKTKILINNAAK